MKNNSSIVLCLEFTGGGAKEGRSQSFLAHCQGFFLLLQQFLARQVQLGSGKLTNSQSLTKHTHTGTVMDVKQSEVSPPSLPIFVHRQVDLDD